MEQQTQPAPTEEEITNAISVINALTQGGPQAFFANPALRRFRQSLAGIVDWSMEKRYNGLSPEEWKAEKEGKRQQCVTKNKAKFNDRSLINNRKLRLGRMNQLKALVETGASSSGTLLPFVPDGPVYDGVNRSAGIHSGSATVPAIQTRATLQIDNVDEGSDDLEITPSSSPEVDQSQAKEETLEELNQEQPTKKRKRETDGGNQDTLFYGRSCYVCKARYDVLHHFYDQLCPSCAELNWAKRMQKVNMTGKIGLLTGGRVKIGYQVGLRLLRCGATLIVSTRFPADAALRFSKENDFDEWKDRLKIYSVDLRDLKSVEDFCDELNARLPRMDFIINNACQTVRRPKAYYRHLMDNERMVAQYLTGSTDSESQQMLASSAIANLVVQSESYQNALLINGEQQESASDVAATNKTDGDVLGQMQLSMKEGRDHENDESLFPVGVYDVNAQQLDLRTKNSWVMKLAEVPTTELLEVTAVNSLSPFIINSKLKPLLLQAKKIDMEQHGKFDGAYIVNVSAMEGKFYRRKNANHPHTNMCKAALNMMTRTSAQDYVEDKIYMNSVDTGWVNDENPLEAAARIAKENNFQTPIDEIDGASRIIDPILHGMDCKDENDRIWGKFLKDYMETEW